MVWKDVPRVMLGVEYKPLPILSLRGGFSADKSAIEWENAGGITQIPQFIDLGTKFSYSFGLGIDINNWTLALASSYMTHPDMTVHYSVDVDSDDVSDSMMGDYKAEYYQTVLGITYRF